MRYYLLQHIEDDKYKFILQGTDSQVQLAFFNTPGDNTIMSEKVFQQLIEKIII